MKKNFVSGVVILSASSFIIKILGFITRIYMSNTMGAEGTGLYQLILSVYAVGASFAVSGISVAVSALTGARPSAGHKVVSSALKITLATGIITSAVVFLFSGRIAVSVGDARAAVPIRIISLCFPFTAAFASLTGYFNGKGLVRLPVAGQMVEQAVRIAIVFLFLKRAADMGVAYACAAASLGICAGEIISGIFLIFSYRKRKTYGRVDEKYTRRLLSISIPSALGGYFCSVMHTAENALIPARFSVSGLNHEKSMGNLGIIKGMALPIAYFPNILISSVATVILPAVSRAAQSGRMGRIKKSADDLFRLCFFAGGFFACFFCSFGKDICMLLYKNAGAGRVLSLMGLCTPFIYINTVSGSILYGAGSERRVLLNSIAEGIMRIFFLWFFIPSFGSDGYIFSVIISAVFASVLNILSVRKVCGAGKSCPKYFICMLISFLISVILGNGLFGIFRFFGVVSLYIFSMIVLKTVRFSDFLWLRYNFLSK